MRKRTPPAGSRLTPKAPKETWRLVRRNRADDKLIEVIASGETLYAATLFAAAGGSDEHTILLIEPEK